MAVVMHRIKTGLVIGLCIGGTYLIVKGVNNVKSVYRQANSPIGKKALKAQKSQSNGGFLKDAVEYTKDNIDGVYRWDIRGKPKEFGHKNQQQQVHTNNMGKYDNQRVHSIDPDQPYYRDATVGENR